MHRTRDGAQIRNVFSIFVELMQNIIRYGVEGPHPGSDAGEKPSFGIVMVSENDGHMDIIAGNYVAKDEAKQLVDRVNELQGGYIPGVRPGEPTAKFLDHIMTRLTLFGAISLTVIAVFPDFLLFTYNATRASVADGPRARGPGWRKTPVLGKRCWQRADGTQRRKRSRARAK